MLTVLRLIRARFGYFQMVGEWDGEWDGLFLGQLATFDFVIHPLGRPHSFFWGRRCKSSFNSKSKGPKREIFVGGWEIPEVGEGLSIAMFECV